MASPDAAHAQPPGACVFDADAAYQSYLISEGIAPIPIPLSFSFSTTVPISLSEGLRTPAGDNFFFEGDTATGGPLRPWYANDWFMPWLRGTTVWSLHNNNFAWILDTPRETVTVDVYSGDAALLTITFITVSGATFTQFVDPAVDNIDDFNARGVTSPGDPIRRVEFSTVHQQLVLDRLCPY